MPREWTSHPPGTKAVRVDLPERVHALLRILAAEHGVAMSVYARQLVENAVRKRFQEEFQDETTNAEKTEKTAGKRGKRT